ncbi:MAG: rRNA maturation RNase YbeY [Ottowia sp.]|nr:rRNA maturation RNase YbeY [Ottowia sp.]
MSVKQPTLALAVQFIALQHKVLLPRPLLRKWVKTALMQASEVTLRFVDEEEGRALNHSYRRKNYATNVLTFSYGQATSSEGDDATPNDPHDILFADIVLCSPVVEQEAQAQNKTLLHHYAHLIIHGVLHAQGYDHVRAKDAKIMEALETALLTQLGYPDPYPV